MLKCSFGWQVFLVCPGIGLQSRAIEDILQVLNFVQVYQLQIKFVPSVDMTKLYSFVVHHICCSLAYGIKISLLTQDQYSLNINTTSSQLLDSTYYKRAIIGQTLTIFNKTSLFPVTSL